MYMRFADFVTGLSVWLFLFNFHGMVGMMIVGMNASGLIRQTTQVLEGEIRLTDRMINALLSLTSAASSNM